MDNRNISGENTTQSEKSEKLRLQIGFLLAFSIATTLVFVTEIRMLDFIEGFLGILYYCTMWISFLCFIVKFPESNSSLGLIIPNYF